MADELLSVLSRFHHEVVMPDIEQVFDARISPLRQEMLGNFDALLKRLAWLPSSRNSTSLPSAPSSSS